MVRAWHFAITAACRAGFSEKYHVSPLSTLGHFFDVCVLGQGTLPLNDSLDLGENEYRVGQKWQ